MKRKLTPDQAKALQLSVVDLKLGLRIVNALERAGILTVETLLMRSPEELLAEIDNFGEQSLDEVYKALALVGFRRRRRKKKYTVVKRSKR